MQNPKRYNLELLTTITIGIIAFAFLAFPTAFAPTPPANWWNTDWQYRKQLIINHTKVASDLVDFPVLVNLTDADLAVKAQIYGDDIVFADSDGQKLDHEIEFYNGTSGMLIAWVKIPNLSSTTDTTVYMYYGNAEALNQEKSEQVWDSNFMMTQHFSERYESLECRFWGMVSQEALPQPVVLDHLINLPNSLKNLGATNPDGWGLAHYNSSQPAINRGQPAANTDPNFNVAAQQLASSAASIGIGHVRKSASPPYNVPDPHPFNRSKLGKSWTFAHHGVISKTVLVELIGDAYLAANPPEYGNNINEWNDSELYFIYILKCIEENSGNVRSGVAEAVTTLSSESSSYNMNFVFSDGTTLWAFRKGDSTHVVYYYYNSTFPQYSVVASQYPTSSQGNWVVMNNYNFVELTRTGAPLVIDDIRTYATIDHFDSTSNKNDGVAHGSVVMSGEGKIDGGDIFDGIDDYISVADNPTLDGDGNWQQMTVEFWVKSTKDNQKAAIVLSKRETGTSPFNSSYQIGFDSAGNSQLFWGVYLDSGYGEAPYSTSPILATNQWYHVVGTFNSPSINLYVNGVLVSSASKSGNILSSDKVPLRIGCRGTGTGTERYLQGVLDEVRISKIARSSSWILTCYNNQDNPSTFYAIGLEETTLQPTMRMDPVATEVHVGTHFTTYVEMVNVENLYAWEFQLNYNQTILDLESCSITPGGLNEPILTFYEQIDEVNGHIWFAVSTTRPTVDGISYSRHAIFEIQFHAIAAGTSSIDLHGTILSDNSTMPIIHEVVDGNVTVTAGYADLEATSITVLNRDCSIYANDTYVDGSTYYYPVGVTINNSGTTDAGPFCVRLDAYWINGSLTENWVEIPLSGLAAGTSITINYTTLFHPLRTGYYRLIATADNQNQISESNETNNILVLDNVPVAVIGDVNGDHEVNILDGTVLSLAWAATPSNPRWNIKADVNHDGIVDVLDGVRVGQHWGVAW